jgi:hypothetical protein
MKPNSTKEFLNQIQQILDQYSLDKELKLIKTQKSRSPENEVEVKQLLYQDMSDLHSFSFGDSNEKIFQKKAPSVSSEGCTGCNKIRPISNH